ncbi:MULTISPECIES: phosphatidate cytidylyltransferase [Chryseobacterium]|uniref:Phosphatidate cytidylyltransferase n=1 Tax=Chryseobacterium camelliae TaxID=1265445 RepID=A0ABU0TN44_9FLAO|nr:MULTISPECIES: phosphatidate cytidylyltransferase [Chryseobacterium]MDT3407685.1 phosphatidate cytidylyltransferase [Pseudacidovorax intermedius]MDQ1098462.1 phosphatidate cytidylyltransferase [Chryseobacterium camelliae]MDQ1102386.1 phosphatidate cytidylyltransferase [Chryseobacterium sp. SORGH_AS_1048]MDR6085823.1 phosphatidate cytidylyltransferase [Chryseobacterium sp. SORGH_AS_0909]MDR6130186.1 phosphatidate cytidylyltransferase [Chryseobacterium sp. SORGH_AS_1175]
MDKNLIQRTLSGIVYVAVIIFCTSPVGAYLLNSISPEPVKQQYLYYGMITLFLAVSSWECFKIMKFGDGYERWAVWPLIIFIFYIFSKRYFQYGFFFDFRLSELLAILLVLIAVVTLFKYPNELYYDSGKLIFTVIYIALPFCFALGLPKFSSYNDHFSLEVMFLFILIWSSDTFAYLVGKFFGKHKMAPKISPKKTWEGYAGGVILTLVLSYFIEHYQPGLRGNWMVVGFLIAAFAPVGDLVESQLKRNFGVKDSGNIIPGHGGLLDRLDSFLICVPVVYLYFILEKFI